MTRTRLQKIGSIGVCAFLLSAAVPRSVLSQDRILNTYTVPPIPIKEFQNKKLPGSVPNDRKVLLGSMGSDLWRGPKDPADEFWMLTDRGPNGQIAVEKIEGLAILDANTIAISNDDDFDSEESQY